MLFQTVFSELSHEIHELNEAAIKAQSSVEDALNTSSFTNIYSHTSKSPTDHNNRRRSFSPDRSLGSGGGGGGGRRRSDVKPETPTTPYFPHNNHLDDTATSAIR